MSSQPRPKIPEALQRQVRRHCGFSCAICGRMPTVYEHIEPYHLVNSHEFENLVLLCLMHHQEVSSDRLSKLVVKKARLDPAAHRKQASMYSVNLSNQYHVTLGNVGFVVSPGATLVPIAINGSYPISIRLGEVPKFSLLIKDKHGDSAISITDNVFNFSPQKLWDVKLSGTKLRVSYGLRKQVLIADISKSNINFKQVKFQIDRVPISISTRGIYFVGMNSGISGITLEARNRAKVVFLSNQTSDEAMLAFSAEPCATDEEAWNLAFSFCSQRFDKSAG